MTTHRLTPPFSQGIFFTKNSMTVVSHTPYFPLISRLKIKLRGHHFDTIDMIKAESQAVLNTLTEHDFKDAFKKCRSSEADAHARKGTTLWLRPGAPQLVFD
jgi:hypothetical protein